MMSALTILILLVAVFTSHAFRVSSITSSIVASHQSQNLPLSIHAIQSIRGGDSDYESDYDDESEEEEKNSKLSASTVKALKKAKKKAEAKQTVSASLKSKSTKKKSSGGIVKKIPYIVRALMNPFTVFAMTKGYFASLFNIDYLQEVSVRDRFHHFLHCCLDKFTALHRNSYKSSL
jgi:hypothetical protein